MKQKRYSNSKAHEQKNQKEWMNEFTKRLEEGVEELFTSDRYKTYLKTMAVFRTYTINNTILIAMQKPDATLVAGEKTWETKFNRHKLPGEKGIEILAPNIVNRKVYTSAAQKEAQEEASEDEMPNAGEEETRQGKSQEKQVEYQKVLKGFRYVTVYDVTQTEGDPVPELAAELTADVKDFNFFMQAIEKVSPVPIRFDKIQGTAKGYYDNHLKEIVIREDMSEAQRLKTAIHELTHAELHDREIMSESGTVKDRRTMEVEAESTAYIVCQHFDLDTSDYSFAYIAGWSSSVDLKELKKSMETIRLTAGNMIDTIENTMQDLLVEREATRIAAQENSYLKISGEIEEYRITKEPTVRILFSESDMFQAGQEFSLHAANTLFAGYDKAQREMREVPEDEDSFLFGYYEKVDFQLQYEVNGEEYIYKGRYDIGDGDGTLLNHISKAMEWELQDLSLLGLQTLLGPEKAEERKNSILRFLEHDLPAMEERIGIRDSAADQKREVSIESTEDYTETNFHKELIDLDVQNKDGTYGQVKNFYRIVGLGNAGQIEALDDRVFETYEQAQNTVMKEPSFRFTDYDSLIDLASKLKNQERTIKAAEEVYKLCKLEHVFQNRECSEKVFEYALKSGYVFHRQKNVLEKIPAVEFALGTESEVYHFGFENRGYTYDVLSKQEDGIKLFPQKVYGEPTSDLYEAAVGILKNEGIHLTSIQNQITLEEYREMRKDASQIVSKNAPRKVELPNLEKDCNYVKNGEVMASKISLKEAVSRMLIDRASDQESNYQILANVQNKPPVDMVQASAEKIEIPVIDIAKSINLMKAPLIQQQLREIVSDAKVIEVKDPYNYLNLPFKEYAEHEKHNIWKHPEIFYGQANIMLTEQQKSAMDQLNQILGFYVGMQDIKILAEKGDQLPVSKEIKRIAVQLKQEVTDPFDRWLQKTEEASRTTVLERSMEEELEMEFYAPEEV